MTLPTRLNRTLRQGDLITLEWRGVLVMLEVKKTGRMRAEILFVAPEEVRIECVSLRANEKDAQIDG